MFLQNAIFTICSFSTQQLADVVKKHDSSL